MTDICMHHEVIVHRVEHLEDDAKDKETRLRSLEKDRWKLAGYSGIISGIIAALAMITVTLIKGSGAQ